MRVRVTLAIDVDPDTLRRETDIVGPNATAAEIRDEIRHLAAVEVHHSTRRYTQRHGQLSRARVR